MKSVLPWWGCQTDFPRKENNRLIFLLNIDTSQAQQYVPVALATEEAEPGGQCDSLDLKWPPKASCVWQVVGFEDVTLTLG